MFPARNTRFSLIVLTIGLVSSFQNLYAQEKSNPFTFSASSKDSLKKHTGVGIDYLPQPEYPGGISAMRKFIEENLSYPSDSVSGKVVVSFMVDTLGHTRHIEIKKSLSSLVDAEVIRVIQSMRFNPAMDNGKAVNSRISLPITFHKTTKY